MTEKLLAGMVSLDTKKKQKQHKIKIFNNYQLDQNGVHNRLSMTYIHVQYSLENNNFVKRGGLVVD